MAFFSVCKYLFWLNSAGSSHFLCSVYGNVTCHKAASRNVLYTRDRMRRKKAMMLWHPCADSLATRPWEGPWGPRAIVAGIEQRLAQPCCVQGQGTEQHGLALRSREE